MTVRWLKERELCYALVLSHCSFIHTVNACSKKDRVWGKRREDLLASCFLAKGILVAL